MLRPSVRWSLTYRIALVRSILFLGPKALLWGISWHNKQLLVIRLFKGFKFCESESFKLRELIGDQVLQSLNGFLMHVEWLSKLKLLLLLLSEQNIHISTDTLNILECSFLLSLQELHMIPHRLAFSLVILCSALLRFSRGAFVVFTLPTSLGTQRAISCILRHWLWLVLSLAALDILNELLQLSCQSVELVGVNRLWLILLMSQELKVLSLLLQDQLDVDKLVLKALLLINHVLI